VTPLGLETTKTANAQTPTRPVAPTTGSAAREGANGAPAGSHGPSRLGGRSDSLPGNARPGTETTLHRAEALDHARSPREPRHDPQRANPPAAVGGVKTLVVTPRGIRAGRVSAPPRAFIVVTGSELVRGDRTDLNGPFLASELMRRGVEPARISIVRRSGGRAGRRARRRDARRTSASSSGGLGPTHDDRTVELVARAAGVGLRLDEELHAQIGGISRAFAARLGRPYVDFETGVQKQATIPEGAISLGLAGTAHPVSFSSTGRRWSSCCPTAVRAPAPVVCRARERTGAPRPRPRAATRASSASLSSAL